ncbi:MAG: chemotaxis protein CheW [Bdellovibrionales bacterium]
MSESTIDHRYMEFRLGDQLYAIPLLTVKEVIQKPEISTVPNMPSHFEGMMNLRGQILGIFQVRKKLSMKASDTKNNSHEVIIVLEQSEGSVGMIVDEVTRVLHAEGDMLQPAPLQEDYPAKKYISAVIRTEDNLVLIVDVMELLEINKHAKAA